MGANTMIPHSEPGKQPTALWTLGVAVCFAAVFASASKRYSFYFYVIYLFSLGEEISWEAGYCTKLEDPLVWKTLRVGQRLVAVG